MPKFQLALIQLRVDGGEKAANLQRAEERIAEAAQHGAQVVLLPEALTAGWTWPGSAELADAIPGGQSCEQLAACARKHGVYVCAGLVECAGDRVYNAAVLIDPAGQIILHHRKINELEIGHPYYALGDRLQVARTPLGTFGLMICADGFAQGQVIGRSLAYMGADVILSPCAWAVPADYDPVAKPYGQLWRDNYGPVCRDFKIWIAGCSNVGPLMAGPWAGRKCIGSSLVVGPNGEQVLQGPFGETAEEILYVDVTPVPRPAQGDGWSGHVP
ncbi:carbon-nitrogen hydrolase family protein [Anatilimnocola floriformis]|uniref:carbon-nitrogen hydrolase family protein n=1 Tax=Anatilimnocola floriformis TaxID=2948575 RepID=UPI0020C3EC70|nr:carbon-nitrogen hydrolase family protein [Anatilimnocola floriformis]